MTWFYSELLRIFTFKSLALWRQTAFESFATLSCPNYYVGRILDLLGRVPLFPCLLDRNSTPTNPHKYAPWPKQANAFGCADRDDRLHLWRLRVQFVLSCGANDFDSRSASAPTCVAGRPKLRQTYVRTRIEEDDKYIRPEYS